MSNHYYLSSLRLALFLALSFLFLQPITAKTTRSNGTGGGNWNTAATWDNGIPVAGDSAIVESGDAVTISSNAAAAFIIITGNGSSVTINSGVTVSLSNSVWLYASSNNETFSFVNNGTVNCSRYFTVRAENFSNITTNLSGTGTTVCQLDNVPYVDNGSLTINWATTVVSRDWYSYCRGASSSLTINLQDSLRFSRDMKIQSVSVAAASHTINMNNASARFRIGNVISLLTNGGQITQGAAESYVYFDNLNNYNSNANLSYRNIGVSGNSTLTADKNLSLLVNNLYVPSSYTLNTNGNDISIPGNFVCNGTLTMTAGDNFTMNGSSAQTISGSGSTTVFDILTINNAAGVSNNHTNLQIRNRLDITNGNYDADGTGAGVTTLLSTSSQTANLGQVLGSISGNITAQRTIPGVNTTDWLYLTSPIQGTTLANFSNCTTGNDKAFYSYGYTGSCQSSAGGYVSSYTYDPSTETTNNGALDGWVAATNSTNAVTPQQGRIFYGGNTAGTYARSSYFLSLTGVPYTGTVVVNAANGARTGTINHSDADGGWFLFGNPYASAVDWVEVLINSGTSRVDVGRCYIYGVNDGGWIELGAISNILPSFQAVMAHSNGASPTVEFEEDDKSTSNAAIVKSNTAAQEMRIKITSPIVPNFSFAIVRFDATGTDAFDSGKDSWQYENIAPFPNVGIVSSDDIKLQVQTTGLTGYKAIPLRTTCHASGNFTLEFSNIAAANACVILEDKLTGNFTTLTDAQNTYSFSMDDTTNAPRFVLHLYEATQSLGTAPGTCHGTNDGSAEIKLHPGSFELTWYNANDSLLHTSQNVSDSASLDQLAPGNYYIEVWRNDAACMPTKEHFTIFAPGEMQPDFTLKGSAFELRTEAPISFRNTSAGPISAYHWDFGDNTTSTLPEPVHTYAKGGSYTVTLTTGNGNPDCDVNTTKALTITDKYLSVNEYGIEGLRVYAHGGQLHTENGLGEGRYRFVNISGQTVGEGVLPSGTQTLSIPDAVGKVFLFATEIDGNSGTYRIIH